MSFKGTLRRTLALLLVLIFALSNMGLAEMAEQIADVPTVEPAIEEASVEEAPVEESEEEVLVEAEAPAEPAPVVSVEAYLIDEDSIFADAAIENWDYELGYTWERATVGTEDWEAIEGATESVYVTTAEDRTAYAYRCVVTAGDVAAESNAVEYDTVAFASDEPIAVTALEDEEVFEVQQFLTDAPAAPEVIGAGSIINNAELSADGIVLTASCAETVAEPVYTWELDTETNQSNLLKFKEGEVETGNTRTIQLGTGAGAANGSIDLATGTTVKVKVKVQDGAKGTDSPEATVDIVLLKDLSTNHRDVTVTATGPVDDELKQDGKKTVTASANVNAGYDVTYSIVGSSDNAGAEQDNWFTQGTDATANVFTVKALASGVEPANDPGATGKKFKVKATFNDFEGVSVDSAEFTVKAAPTAITLKAGKTTGKSVVFEGDVEETTLTADVTPAGAYTKDLVWSVSGGAKAYVSCDTGAAKGTTTLAVTPQSSIDKDGFGPANPGEVKVTVKDGESTTVTAEHTIKVLDKFTAVDQEGLLTLGDDLEDDAIVTKGTNLAYALDVDADYKVSFALDDSAGTWATLDEATKLVKVKNATDNATEPSDGGQAVKLTATFSDTQMSGVKYEKTFKVKNDVGADQKFSIYTATEKKALVGSADTIVLTAYLADAAIDGKTYTGDLSWDIENNAWDAYGILPYFTVAGSADGDNESDKSITVSVVQGDNAPQASSPKDNGPKVVLKHKGKTVAEYPLAYLQPLTVDNLDKNIVVAKSYPQPAEKEDDPTVYTLALDDTIDSRYPVTWAITDENGGDTNKGKFLDVNGNKFSIKGATDTNGAVPAEGVKFKVTATAGGKTGSTTFTVLPNGGKVTLYRVTGDDTDPVETKLEATDLNVTKGDTLKLTAKMMNGENEAFGGIRSWQVLKGDDMEDLGIKPNDKGVITVPTTEVCTLTIKAFSDVEGIKPAILTVNVQEKPTGSRTSITSERNYVFDKGDGLELTVTSTDASGKEAYVDNLCWWLSDVPEDDATEIGFGTKNFDMNDGANGTVIGKTVKLFAKDSSATATGLTVTVNVGTIDAAKNTKTVLKSTKIIVFPIPTDLGDAIVAENAADTEYTQGETMKVKLGDKLAGMTTFKQHITYEVSVNDEVTTAGAEIEDLIDLPKDEKTKTVIKTNTTGTFKTFAVTPKENATAEDLKSIKGYDHVITNTMTTTEKDNKVVKVTITAKLDGAPTADMGTAVTYTLRPVPATVTLQQIKFNDADKKLDPDKYAEVKPENLLLFKGDTAAFTVKFDSWDEAVAPVVTKLTSSMWTATAKPATGVSGTIYSITKDTTDYKWSEITATKAGTVDLTFTYNGISDTKTLTLSDEDIKVDPATVTGALPDGHPANHIWKIVESTEKNVSDTNKHGHYYECTYEKDDEKCPAKSLGIAHEFVLAEKPVVKGDAAGNAGTGYDKDVIACKLCGYTCVHEDYAKQTFTYVDAKYHKATCPVCGQELLEEHKVDATSTYCSVCKSSRATVAFADPTEPAVVVVGDTEGTPLTLKVDGALSWTTEYSVKAGSEAYIDVSDEGVVTAKGPLVPAEMGTAVVVATVTIDGEGTMPATVLTAEKKIKVEAAATGMKITGAPTFVTPDIRTSPTAAPVLVKLTVETDQGDAADLRGYQWRIANSDDFTGIDLYKNKTDADTKKDTADTGKVGAGYNGTIAWLSVDTTAAYASGVKSDPNKQKPIEIEFVKLNGGTQVEGSEKGTASIKFLPTLDEDLLQGAIKVDKAIVGQGDQVIVTNTLDPDYGTVEYSLKCITDNTMSDSRKNRWVVKGATSGNETTFNVLADDKSTNHLSADTTPEMEFEVVATIRLAEKTSTTEPKTITSDSNTAAQFTIIPAADSVAIQEYAADAAGKKDWTALTAKTLTVGDSIIVRAVALDADKKVVEDYKDDTFTWNLKDNAAFKVENMQANAPETAEAGNPATPTGIYKLTVTKDAKASEAVTAASAFGTATVTVTVEQPISSITLTVTPEAVGAGEVLHPEAGGVADKYIEVEAKVEPEGFGDELNWDAKYVTIEDGEMIDASITKPTIIAGSDEFHKLIRVPDTTYNRDASDIISVSVWGTKQKKSFTPDPEIPGDEFEPAHKEITIFRAPTPAEPGLALTVEGADAQNTVNLLVGESAKVTKCGYDAENGYGSTVPVGTPVVINEKKADTAAADAHVIAVEGDETNGYKVVAGCPGTADIAIYAYNDDPNNAESARIKATVSFVVAKAPDVVKMTTTETEKVLGVGHPDGIEIEDAALSAADTAADGTETPVTGVNIVIREAKDAAQGKVSITHDATAKKWTIKGAEAGETDIVAAVGETESETKIHVIVRDAANSIDFYEGDTKLAAQKVLAKDATFELSLKTDPADPFGEITWTWPQDETVIKHDAEADAETGAYTITAVAAGTATITAKIYNKDWIESAGDTAANPQYLLATLEILVTEEGGDEPIEPPTPSENSVKFIGKQAIGPSETTRVYVTGVADGEKVTWSTEPASGVISVEKDADDQTVATVKYEAIGDGKATVIATITGTAGERTAEGDIYTLTAPEGITLMHMGSEVKNLTMGLNETIYVGVELTGGYTFATPELKDEADAEDISYSDAPSYTITSDNETLVTVSYDSAVTAKKQPGKNTAAPNLKVSMVGLASPLTVPVTIVKANKSFNIGAFNGSTLYMMPDDSKTIDIKTNPGTSFVNLDWEIEEESDVGDSDSLIITQADKALTLKTEAAEPDAIFHVVLKSEGYKNRAEQDFTVVVQAKAEEGDKPKIAVRKTSTDGTGYATNEDGTTTATGSVKVVKNEKLQAYFVDQNGQPIAGTVSWTALSKSEKKKVTISETGLITAKGTSGSVTINGSVNGMAAEPITIELAKAPKYALEPNETTRTVAVGEEFELALTSTDGYPDSKANIWFTIDATNDLGFASVEGEDGEDKESTYTFNKPGTTTLSLNPVWGGKAKTVKFTVVEPKAEDFVVPDTATVATKGDAIIRADLGEGYANLTWRLGDTATSPVITTKAAKWNNMNSIKVKKLANDEIQITTNKAPVGTEIKLLVQSAENTEGKQIVVTVKEADQGFPADTEVVFDKPVITVGESTTVSVKYADDVETPPTGSIKYSYEKSSEGKVSVKGNVVKATKPGLVTVSAKLGSGTPITGQLFVLPKASIETSMKPTAMGADETLTMDVTLKNYDLDNAEKPVPTTPEYLREGFSTKDVLTAESNSSLIGVKLSQDPDTDTPNVYQLTLDADAAVKNSKGKYTSATITLKLTNGAKKTFKIQVVNGEDIAGQYDAQLPESITVAKGMSVTLNPAVREGLIAPNLNWRFASDEDAAAAKEHLLTISDGKVVADKNATATNPDEPIEIQACDAWDDVICSVDVNIVATKVAKNGFSIEVPQRTLYAGERILATVKYNAGSGAGDVTWKSKRSTVISVDKKSGMLTVKGPYKKYSDATIVATANKKTATAKLTVAPAVQKVEFTKDVLMIDPTKEKTVDLAKYVKLDGNALGSAESIKGVVSFDAWSDDATELATIDPATGVLTLVTAPEGETLNGTMHAEVVTYNDLYADMLIEIGEGSESGGEVTPPEPPVKEQVANSIELKLNDYELSATEPLTLKEGGAAIQPTYTVKDTDGVVMADAKVAWSTDDSTETPHIEFNTADGTLKPVTYTTAAITVTAKVLDAEGAPATKEDGSEISASYKVAIDPVMTGKHLVFTTENDQKILHVNGTMKGNISIAVEAFAQYLNDVVVESDNPEVIAVTKNNQTDDYQIAAIAKGKANITAYVMVDGVKIEMDPKFEVTVVDDAKPEDIEFTTGVADGKLTLSQYETVEIGAKFINDFEGLEEDDTFGLPVAYLVTPATDPNAEPTEGSAHAAFDIAAKTDAEGNEVIGAWTVKATGNAAPTKQYKIVVTAFGAKKSFDVTVEKAPEIKSVEATVKSAGLTEANHEAVKFDDIATSNFDEINATANDEVILKATTEGNWKAGFGWEIVRVGSDEVSEDNKETLLADVTLDTTGADATLKSTVAQEVAVKFSFQEADPDEIKDFTLTVNFKAAPTIDNVSNNDVVSSATPKIINEEKKIGIGETMKAKIEFTGSAYASNITWTAAPTGYVSLDYAKDNKECTITGVKDTPNGTSVIITARAGTVRLAEYTLSVLKDSKTAELRVDNGTEEGQAFDFNFKKNADKKLYVKLDANASATCELEISGGGLANSLKYGADKYTSGMKNCWTIPGSDLTSASNTVTVILRMNGKVVKQYSAAIAN